MTTPKKKRRSGRRARELEGLSKSRDAIDGLYLWRYQGPTLNGQRGIRQSLGRCSAEEAIARRDALLDGVGGFMEPKVERGVRFAGVADLYLDGPRFERLATTTKRDRQRLLKPEGRIIQYLGDRLLDEITPDVLEQYWIEEVLGKNRKEATGTQDIAAIAAVFKLARKKKFTTENPCGVFVGELHEDSTKADRAERVPGKDIRPTSGEETKALLVASEEESMDDLVYTLLMLDGGLRSGEALGLRHFRRYARQVRCTQQNHPLSVLETRRKAALICPIRACDRFSATPRPI